MRLTRRSFVKTGLLFVPTIFSAGVHGAVRLGNLDTEVYGWMTRVRANSGQYTSLSVVANDVWMKLVRAAGVRSIVRRANTFTGLDLAASFIPLIKDYGSATDSNSSFVAGDYSEATGRTGNTSSKSSSTGFDASASFPGTNDCHMACYNRTNGYQAGVVMGALNSGVQVDWMLVGYIDTNSYAALHAAGAGAITYADATNPQGFYQANRVSSSDFQLYKNGASVASTAAAGGTLTTAVSIQIHADYDVSLGPQNWSNKALAGYSLGGGMTVTQAAQYYAAWQRMQTILGRQV